jgi:hypothetical protein
MAKVIQIKVSRKEIDDAVKAFIQKKIDEACKKQKVVDQINFEIEQAVIEVNVPEHESRIAFLESELLELKKKLR